MNRITGQLRVRETGVPCKDLTAHLYQVGVRQVPASILDDSKWDALFGAEWKDLDALRIGSASSEETGRFVLDYDPDALPRLARDGVRPNLWLAVTGPDLTAAHPCPVVVHASCDIRIGAGAEESFVVPLEEWRLRRIGHLGAAPQIRRGRLPAASILSAVEKLAATARKPDLAGQRFSEHFNERHKKRTQEQAEAGLRPRKQAQFAVPVAMATKADGNPRLSIRPDAQGDRLTVHSQNEPGGKPLFFKGIRRQAATSGTAPLGVEIDDSSGAFELTLTRVPDDLKLDQSDPLALWVPPLPR